MESKHYCKVALIGDRRKIILFDLLWKLNQDRLYRQICFREQYTHIIMLKAPEIPEFEYLENTNQTREHRNAVIVPVRDTPKIQRNQKCPCGSGAKYKHCHYHSDQKTKQTTGNDQN